MQDNFKLKKMSEEDRTQIIDIFNYYIENSYAAYPENKVGYEFFDMFLNSTKGYPTVTAKTIDGEIIGFGLLRAYSPMPAFRRTAEISYFMKPEYVGKKLGKLLLDYLLDEAKKMNIDCVLASISSLNEISLKFHFKNGFKECGRFIQVGKKKNQDFDVVWMQKLL